ncbi:hypothetical protein VI817_005460 [Penicillium citrinum]|nr:hypothetical protein VI817_005460 [Penicillium citrinum]
MRSTLFLAALAAGAAHAYEKRVYVTDWTTVTVTKTVTAPAVTETVAAVQQNQADTVTLTSTSTPVQAPAPVAETTSLTSDLAKKSTEVVPEPAPTQAAQQEPVSSWSTAWTSTFEAAPATTLQPQPQPSSSTSTSSAAAATGGTYSVTKEYTEKVLYNHNVHRSNHSVSSLEWHDDLLQAAGELASNCVYEHNT